VIGAFLERPSKRARASERFDLRTRVETVEEVAFVATEMWRMTMHGAGVREIVREGVIGRGNSRAGMGMMEGRRGGVDDIGEGMRFGGSGRVIEGAGLGDGIDLKESRGKRVLDGSDIFGSFMGAGGNRFKLAERMDCDSARSRERKDLYSG
jgi:hypothetical protein